MASQNDTKRKKVTFSSSEISAVTKNALVKPVAAQTTNLFSLVNPMFGGSLSDIDMQLGDTAKKTYERFCAAVSALGSQLSQSLTDAVEISEYSGKENEEFSSLEKSIFEATVPLVMKRKKKTVVEYELYGAYSKAYPSSEYYTTDDMVYTSKLRKKRLNFKPGMALGECYKILNEISLNKDNQYSSYASLPPKDVYEANTAFIEYNVVENGGVCYRVVSDKYAFICFKLNISVPLYFSDEQKIRYQTLDLSSDEDILYSRYSDGSEVIKKRGPDGNYIKVEALRRLYRKIMKERLSKLNSSKNRMFEARRANFEDLDEEYALLENVFKKSKEIVDNIQSGNLLLSNVDKQLRDVADNLAQLNILIDVAKEFYGNIDSFTITDPDYYLNKYKEGFFKTMQRAYVRSKVPSVKFDVDFESEKTSIFYRTAGDFDNPINEKTIKFLVGRAGKQSDDINKLQIDVGREGVQRAVAKLENGNAVFSVFSKSYDKNAYDAEQAKMFRVPGKIIGLCKLIISQEGFKIVGTAGRNPEV